MARIGLLKPRVAKYSASGTTVTYSDGQILSKAISHDLSLENTDPVKLFADDGACESVSGFSSGTLTIVVDELPMAEAGLIFGITPESISTPSGTGLTFDDDAQAPYLGYGVIVPQIRNGERSWMAVLLTKIVFNITGDTFSTKGETIEFQTPELTATVLRDDTAKHAWRKYAVFASEANADAWLNAQLSIATSNSTPATTE